jgi:hypothetical protein
MDALIGTDEAQSQADTYVFVKYSAQAMTSRLAMFSTPITENDASPHWDYTYKLFGYADNATLSFRVMHKEARSDLPDIFLGQATKKIAEVQALGSAGFTGTLPLVWAGGDDEAASLDVEIVEEDMATYWNQYVFTKSSAGTCADHTGPQGRAQPIHDRRECEAAAALLNLTGGSAMAPPSDFVEGRPEGCYFLSHHDRPGGFGAQKLYLTPDGTNVGNGAEGPRHILCKAAKAQ